MTPAACSEFGLAAGDGEVARGRRFVVTRVMPTARDAVPAPTRELALLDDEFALSPRFEHEVARRPTQETRASH
jgi:hypothetical protein